MNYAEYNDLLKREEARKLLKQMADNNKIYPIDVPVRVDGWVGSVTLEPSPDKTYPDNNPKTVLGLKKPSLSAIPPAGMFHLGLAMDNGRNKYGAMNWREKRVSSSIYYDAALRHLLSWYDGEDYAEDSGVHHLGHAMACLSIVLDAMETGNLNDDRPHKGVYSKLVDKYVKDKS